MKLTQNRQQRTTTLNPGRVSNTLQGGGGFKHILRRQHRLQFLKWFKTSLRMITFESSRLTNVNMVLYYEEAKTRATDTMCCVTVGDPWTSKHHHWKSEAKDHQLSPSKPGIPFSPN